MIKKISAVINLLRFKRLWRRMNVQNHTMAGNVFPIELVIVGKYTYGVLNVKFWNHPHEKLIIGAYVSIAENVTFILGGNHTTSGFMTYPLRTIKLGYDSADSYSKGAIIVEDDVWIGFGATILSGLTIGRGSVIAAGSVVTKSFPPYSVIGGNPAKLIKYRFEHDILSMMETIDFNMIDLNTLAPSDIDVLSQVPDGASISKVKTLMKK